MTVTRFPRASTPAAPAAEASFLVNIQTGSVVGAGRLAAVVLGFDATRTGGHPLDAAMPAVGALRAFALSGAPVSVSPVTLVIWSRRSSVAAMCVLERTAPEAGNTLGGALIRVTITNIHDLLAPRADLLAPRASVIQPHAVSSPVEIQRERIDKRALARSQAAEVAPRSGRESGRESGGEGAANGAMAPRDDRATLQLIARRIEDGVKLSSRGQPPEHTPVSDASDLPIMPAPDVMAASTQPRHDAHIDAVAELDPARAGNKPAPLQNDEPRFAIAPLPLEANDNAAHIAFPAPAPTLSHDALAQLLAQTAHDIKTPLSAISAASEIIRDERLGPSGNERYRTYAADIHASARHALAIVDRLLKMPSPEERPANSPAASHSAPPVTQPATAKPEAKPEAAPQPAPSVNLNALVAGCAQELKPLTDARQLHLNVWLDPAAPHVQADAVGLKQSLLNVLTNAMKFTPAGGTLDLATETLSSHGVLVSVRDTGCGMTKGAIARFLQTDEHRAGEAVPGKGMASPSANTAQRRTATGLGFGMPQVRTFCRTNNAELSIDSTLNRGTVVTLMFKN